MHSNEMAPCPLLISHQTGKPKALTSIESVELDTNFLWKVRIRRWITPWEKSWKRGHFSRNSSGFEIVKRFIDFNHNTSIASSPCGVKLSRKNKKNCNLIAKQMRIYNFFCFNCWKWTSSSFSNIKFCALFVTNGQTLSLTSNINYYIVLN